MASPTPCFGSPSTWIVSLEHAIPRAEFIGWMLQISWDIPRGMELTLDIQCHLLSFRIWTPKIYLTLNTPDLRMYDWMSRAMRKNPVTTWSLILFLTYCWKKSCTTQHVWHPVNNGIFTISTGAGFLPSTVCSDPNLNRPSLSHFGWPNGTPKSFPQDVTPEKIQAL